MTSTAPAAPPHAPERPATAYRVLERRATVTAVGVLLVLAALGWFATWRQAEGMDDMLMGLVDVRSGMDFDLAAPVFLAMWLTMMVAMMFPTIAPVVLLHRLVMRRRGVGVGPTVTFVLGYLLVWTVAGLVPLAALYGFNELRDGGAWVDRLAGITLVVAGAYQFTRWKALCQKACRSPLSFVSTHDFGSGPLGTLRAGASHGLYCLGCCWALMAVLLVVGIMSFVWMAAIAAVFLAEKNWSRGDLLTKVVGTGLVAFGVLVVFQPDLLPAGMEMESPGAPMEEMDPMGEMEMG